MLTTEDIEMMRGGKGAVVVVAVALLQCLAAMTAFAATVTYDHRALVIDGKRRVLVSGSIHYPRSTSDVHYSFPSLSLYIYTQYVI